MISDYTIERITKDLNMVLSQEAFEGDEVKVILQNYLSEDY